MVGYQPYPRQVAGVPAHGLTVGPNYLAPFNNNPLNYYGAPFNYSNTPFNYHGTPFNYSTNPFNYPTSLFNHNGGRHYTPVDNPFGYHETHYYAAPYAQSYYPQPYYVGPVHMPNGDSSQVITS